MCVSLMNMFKINKIAALISAANSSQLVSLQIYIYSDLNPHQGSILCASVTLFTAFFLFFFFGK